MFAEVRYLLLFWALSFRHVDAHCVDIHSHIVSQGIHYVPGANPCTLCICDKGSPKWCKTVLCSPPQNCKSFQVGSSCCEFKCLDDILAGHDSYKETYDVALRFIASAVTAVLSISLIFFLYNRLKRNKLLSHNHRRDDHQQNINNVGYITGNFGYTQHNMGYLGACNNDLEISYEETSMNFTLWKPPGNYFPNGEAPPPYEEAMRSAQAEMNQINNTNNTALINTLSCSHPQQINAIINNCIRQEEETSTSARSANPSAHQYVNLENIQKRKAIEPPVTSQQQPKEHTYANVRNVTRPSTSSNFIHKKSPSYQKTRHTNVNTSSSSSSQSCVAAATASSSRSNPNLEHCYKIKISNDHYRPVYVNTSTTPTPTSRSKHLAHKKTLHRTLPKNLRELLTNAVADSCKTDIRGSTSVTGAHAITAYDCASRATNIATIQSIPSIVNSIPSPADTVATLKDIRQQHSASYHSLSQDEEDYRSECENCKSQTNIVDDEACNETMSLQRRPLSEFSHKQSYNRISLTLPTNNKKERPNFPSPTNRGQWFSSMHHPSTSSDESD